MKYWPRILIVDDETDFLKVMTAVLRNNRFEVYSVPDGKEVFNAVSTFKPDIILLDVKLGSHDGREICEQLKRNLETKHIKVLLHSAFPHVTWEYQNCGADDFLLKPYNLSDLIDKIKLLLRDQFE